MVGRLRHRVRRLPQLQWLPRVLWSTILGRWFFLSSFCGFWVFSLSGHDCATTPAGTGKNAINFRPCFVLFFFSSFFCCFVTYRFRSNDFFRPLFMCCMYFFGSPAFDSGSCSLCCPCFSLNFRFPPWVFRTLISITSLHFTYL